MYAIRSYYENEDLKKLSLQRLNYLYSHYDYSTVFAVSAFTKNYWREKYERLDVLSVDDDDDSWFFNTLKNKVKTTLNYDRITSYNVCYTKLLRPSAEVLIVNSISFLGRIL